MLRYSTSTSSTDSDILIVCSSVLPVFTFFTRVRTNAAPLPGLMCWNSVTTHGSPCKRSTTPFLISDGDDIYKISSSYCHPEERSDEGRAEYERFLITRQRHSLVTNTPGMRNATQIIIG